MISFWGGSPSAIATVSAEWTRFGKAAEQAADDFRAVNDAGFDGTEGEKYARIVHADFPEDLDTTGDAHSAVGRALMNYSEILQAKTTQMSTLMNTARVTHGAHRSAVAAYNTAEANAIRARATATAATATALGSALIPGVNAVTASAAATAQSEAAAAEAAFAAAKTEYHAVNKTWLGHLESAAGIKRALVAEVEVVVADIDRQTQERFAPNKNWLQRAGVALDNWFDDNAEWLKTAAGVLAGVAAVVSFFFPPAGMVLGAASLLLTVGLAATGNQSWTEVLIDVGLSVIPFGRAFKAAKGTRAGKNIANAVDRATPKSVRNGLKNIQSARHGVAENMMRRADAARGPHGADTWKSRAYDRMAQAIDPVDIATGAMVHEHTDVLIPGTLPLIVDRTAYSSHNVGWALGPQWVSRLDVRIEVTDDHVYMLTPTGAMIAFPSAPTDGSEVQGDGRPWLLSYSDGAYRVRDVAQGVTYVFAVAGSADTLDHDGPLPDQSPAVDGSYVGVGIPTGSLADDFGLGIEVGISSMIHHTGHRIDYFYDQATGHMVQMRRSDDTRLDIVWDAAVDRAASVWVSNPTTHPDDQPMRLISYEYDPLGRLVRVVNSNAGSLRYYYNDAGLNCGWTDRNGVSYHHVYDTSGRVVAQAGTGGIYANAVVYLTDEGTDAPAGGTVSVTIETVRELDGDPLEIGDDGVPEILERLQTLPLVEALKEHGLSGVGLTGRGRTGSRDNESWTIDPALLHDEVLGQLRPTVYRSTVHGDVWRVISAEGGVTDQTFDEHHAVTSVTNSAGATTTTRFDEYGSVVEVTYPDGTSTHVEPGSWGAPVRVVGRDGQVTEYEVDGCGLTTGVVDPTGARVSMDYEIRPSGAVLSVTTNPEGLTTTVECDDAGRQLAVVDPAGRRSSVVRDVRGLVTESMDPEGHATTIAYSPEGWPMVVTHPDGSAVSVTYDGEGNRLSVTNEIGVTSTTQYTVMDTPVATTDASGATTRLRYNSQLEPVALTNADNNTWSYEYDRDGMIVREVDYNGIVTESSLSADGLVSTTITPAGVTTTVRNPLGLVEEIIDGAGSTVLSYDHLGRVDTIINRDTTVSYVRDDYGRMVGETVTLASGESTSYSVSLTATGLVASHEIGLPGGGSVTTAFEHSEVGEIASSAIAHVAGGLSVGVPVADITYGRGVGGQRDRISVGSLVRSFEYDVRGRLVADRTGVLDSRAQAGVRGVVGRDFSWRADTVLTSISDQLRGSTVFDVDVLGRVTGVRRDASGRGDSSSSAVVSGRLGHPENTAATAAVTESYGFSAAGVLSSIAAPTGGAVTGAAGTGVSSVSPASSGLDAQVEFAGTMPTRVGRTTYTYDKAGRVVQTVTKRVSRKPLVKRFYYATSGQPMGFDSSDQSGVGFRYVYDGLGRRVAKEQIDTTTGEVTGRTVFGHVGDQLVAEQATVGKDAGRGFVWVQDPATGETTGQITLTNAKAGGVAGGGSRPAAGAESDGRGRPAAGGVRDWDQDRVDAEFFALVGDLVGAPHEIVDPVSGQVVGRSSQTLYGQRSWRGEQASPLLFAGQYYDEESGWAYNRFRYYSPEAGVYNAQDPLGVSPRVASAQGYVDHAGIRIDFFGLHDCPASKLTGFSDRDTEVFNDVRKRLLGHRDTVIERWNNGEIDLSESQERHIKDTLKQGRWPRSMHRGTALDMELKGLVESDRVLKQKYGVQYAVQGQKGADFIFTLPDSGTQVWMDLTTPGQWSTHVRKYGTIEGIPTDLQLIGYQNAGFAGMEDFYGTVAAAGV
ncbi:DUF6531 domain-containing protein [Corynebacterium cystitidis]|uniref:RHS repeat-associated core domain-containing protein n=1 Tax=Corynebacterium cystitidis DSM 20524 TaxID=1121357 RepID=A0A1H9UB35_9CORY|nr:DUF6531 domain-containing protein [Corynebacterium cystitidis]WJY81276.1 Putative deoxyribonuclease RhsC [Corynebacterium cystitidis DSM 20524]SES06675.1 RHS repeat-associated core domain-containing protein [Corynebacterium cystitidis DSM 20524]SNV88740.1 Uncharacterized conserved protein [Corynebacterium cystitidis]